jgi:hypothetical protein
MCRIMINGIQRDTMVALLNPAVSAAASNSPFLSCPSPAAKPGSRFVGP